MNKFIRTTLQNKINIKHGFPFLGEYFISSGKYIVLTPGNFYEEGGFKLQIGKEKFYNNSFPKEYLHQKGDLIVAMTEQGAGLLGSAAIVPLDNRYLHNQRLGLITMNENEMDKIFMYYLLNSKYIRKQISLSSTGTKVKHTSPKRIYDVVALLPNIITQQKIAKVLSTLDAKIELNNRINKELEAMAKTLYDYWFVQFDFPDDEGKPYKSSGGTMVYSEELKREIPEGWEVKKLSQIANITMGQSPSSNSYNENREGKIFFQGSTDFGWRFPEVRQFTTEPSRLAKKGDILLSVRAPVGTLNIADNDCCIGRGLAALNSKSNFNAYLFYVMTNFKKIFDLRNDTGTTFGSITKDDLFSLKLAYPSEKILQKFDEIILSSHVKILNNSQQSQHLTQLRDFLLPMLMNGQVSVKS